MAKGKSVLEIGAFRGRSTVYLGLSASLLLTCDHFQGQRTLLPGQRVVDMHEVQRDWQKNVRLFGLSAKVRLLQMDSMECYRHLQRLGCNSFGLVFVDGGHDDESITHDVGFAELLTSNGVIAFHDYFSEKFPSIKRTVDAWSSGEYGARFNRITAVGSIVAFQRTHGIEAKITTLQER
jgi:predicted O-methyltransferase YrrM